VLKSKPLYIGYGMIEPSMRGNARSGKIREAASLVIICKAARELRHTFEQ